MTTTTNTLFNDTTIGFIGSGVMAEAMIAGMLAHNAVTPQQIIAADLLPERGQQLTAQYGIRATTQNLDIVNAADVLILAIKPQVLDKVLAELHGKTNSVRLVLSIIAGASIEHISAGLANPNVVRAMPNTPARIGQGMTVWMAQRDVPEAQRAQAAAILGTFGQEVYMDGEEYLDMATAISGSGPAYVFLFMEAMIDAGVHLGFPRRVAEQLVIQTVRGSVEYAAASKTHPSLLRNEVTSPGGTTAEAIYHLERGGLLFVIARAIWAAYQRSVGLGAAKKGHIPTYNPEAPSGDR